MAFAPAAQAVLIDRVGPRRPNAPPIASASAWGGTSSTSPGSGAPPCSRSLYHCAPLSSPALQVPITTPQRSAVT